MMKVSSSASSCSVKYSKTPVSAAGTGTHRPDRRNGLERNFAGVEGWVFSL
jgi:hypothetical protein